MTERDSLIIAKRPIVAKVVKAYLRKNPTLCYLRDDLMSAGTVRLVEELNNLKPTIDNVDGYLTSRIRYALSDFVAEEQTIRVPPRTRSEKKKAGTPLPYIKVGQLPASLVDAHSGDPLTKILESCRDDRDRKIVRLLAAGCTQGETADELGIHPSSVSRILKAIEACFDADGIGSDESATCERKVGTSTKCGCGQPVTFANETRCEDCWAVDQNKYHGRSMRVNFKKHAA